MGCEIVINITNLDMEKINNLEIGKPITLESNGKIINDTWDDIPKKLSEIFGDFINELWDRAYYKCFKFDIDGKRYSLWHGNTKWFTLKRLEIRR